MYSYISSSLPGLTGWTFPVVFSPLIGNRKISSRKCEGIEIALTLSSPETTRDLPNKDHLDLQSVERRLDRGAQSIEHGQTGFTHVLGRAVAAHRRRR